MTMRAIGGSRGSFASIAPRGERETENDDDDDSVDDGDGDGDDSAPTSSSACMAL